MVGDEVVGVGELVAEVGEEVRGGVGEELVGEEVGTNVMFAAALTLQKV